MNHLVSWIEEENSDRLKPESQEHLRLLREQVAKMDRLIKGILDYSRTASEHHSREWVEVKGVIDETIELFSYKQNMNIRWYIMTIIRKK